MRFSLQWVNNVNGQKFVAVLIFAHHLMSEIKVTANFSCFTVYEDLYITMCECYQILFIIIIGWQSMEWFTIKINILKYHIEKIIILLIKELIKV